MKNFKFNSEKTSDSMKVVNKHTAPWLTLLTTFFIVLKVLGIGSVAAWSWGWVLSPLWIPLVIVLGIVVVVAVFMLLLFGVEYAINSRKKKKPLNLR